jgi:hypothetical protein
MNTSRLVLTSVAIAIIPALVFMGCNKKEDEVPAPSAVAPAPPPPPATPPPAAATEAPKVVVLAKPLARGDGGVAKGEAGAVVVQLLDGGKVAFPTIPVIPISAIPGVASAIVGGVIGAIPSNLIPPPPK